MARGKVWTDEEVKYIKKAVGKMTVQEIADELGVSYRTVRNKLNRLGVSVREERSKVEEYILYQYNNIKVGTLEELADYVGMKVDELLQYRSKNKRRNVIII